MPDETAFPDEGYETDDAGVEDAPVFTPDAPAPPDAPSMTVNVSVTELPFEPDMTDPRTCVVCGRSFDAAAAYAKCESRPDWCSACCPHPLCNARSPFRLPAGE